MNNKIRCACGKSRRMPWCDGSHRNEQWACEPVVQVPVERAFYAPTDLVNLAKRLAWRFDGEVLSPGRKAKGRRLVVIDDGTDLSGLKSNISRFDFAEILYITVDFAPDIIANALGFEQYFAVSGSLGEIFVRLEANIEPWLTNGNLTEDSTSDSKMLKRVFISHAVADEALLLPVVDSLRQLTEMNMFLCFDSIVKGEKWRRQIDSALSNSELFVFIISKASVQSTYCAFEVGCAHSLNKPICLISVDGTLPPPFVSQIHCIDLLREINAKPWLDLESALTLELLNFTAKMGK